MNRNKIIRMSLLMGLIMLIVFSFSAFAEGDAPERVPDMVVSRNMKTAAENIAANTGTESEQVGIWGTFGGSSMAYTPGKAEDGVSSALHITGGANGGGGQLALNDSGFCTRTVTHKDAAGNTIGTTKGFIDASEFVLRVKSTGSFSIKFVAEYRVAPTSSLTSKGVTVPSTNGEWKDIVFPLSSFEPETNGKWIYNMLGAYTSNFNPVILLKIEGANFGDSRYATIGEMRMNWYKDEMVYEAKIQDQKTSYYQYYDNFDYESGTIITKRGDSSVLVNNAKVLSGQASSQIGLTNGDSKITIQSKAKDGTLKNYNISVNSTASSNNDLASLTLSYGKLDQPFDPSVTEYTATFPSNTGKVKFYPRSYDANATMTVNTSNPIVNGGNVELTINSGTMTIPITVYAQDGSKKVYTITTTKGVNSDSNADLYNLSLSKGYLDQKFDPNVTEYTATVSNTTTSITVTPIKEASNSTITVNGTTVNSNKASSAINLEVGENVITVVVTSKDTTNVKTYTFTVTREDVRDDNADLFLATVATATLDKDFKRDITEYYATVEGNVSSVKITPTKADANATIKVNGANVNSGSASGSISLSVGLNTIPVVVTAKDGVTTKTYHFNITRKPASTDANLFDLKLSNGKFSEPFNSETVAYTVDVANGVSSIQLTPIKSNSYATIKVNNSTVASGATSSAINLAVGDNTIKVEVTAQSGAKKTYTLTVKRADADDNNADLFNVKISNGVLKSDFDPAVTTYQAQVSSETDSITIVPTASDSNATIKVNGTTVENNGTSQRIALNNGENTINIVVTSLSGATKTYTFVVTRTLDDDQNASLLNLELSGGILTPAFSPSITEYTLTVPNSIGKVTVTPTKEVSGTILEELSLTDPRVSISGFNNTAIKNDPNETKNLKITVNVLSQTITYYVRIIPFAPPNLVDITVDSPKLTYYVNDPFDFNTGKIIANYSDKDPEQAALNDKNAVVTGFDSSAPVNGQEITVTYGGKSTTYTVDIIQYTIPGLTAISVNNVKKLYKVGEPFDLHTGTIIPVINGVNGQAVKLYNRYATITGFDSTEAVSNQVITVSYSGQTTTYEIDIIEEDLPVAYYLEQTMQSGSRPDSWGGWGGLTLSYVAGKGEDNQSAALHLTGSTSGGGGQVAFSGNVGAGSIRQSDGTYLNGFIGMDAIKIRYNSTKSTTLKFQMDYRASDKPTLSSKGVQLPSTGGVWTDIVIPIRSFEPTASGATFEEQRDSVDWLYNNFKGSYTTDFEPVILLRFEGSLGADYVTVGNMKFLWYETKAIDRISVSGAQTSYHQFESFNADNGQVIVHYKDGSTRATTLTDAGVSYTGFDSTQPSAGQEITVTYAGKTTTYLITVTEGGYDPHPVYVSQGFVTTAGYDMYYFDGKSDVVAKITLNNPDAVTKQPYGVLFVVAYNGNKVVNIKTFEKTDIPQGTSALTVQFTTEELEDVTRLKIIALKDEVTQEPIFTSAANISKLIF